MIITFNFIYCSDRLFCYCSYTLILHHSIQATVPVFKEFKNKHTQINTHKYNSIATVYDCVYVMHDWPSSQ
jgi:hypothetical protein